jgi:hypothetical protein
MNTTSHPAAISCFWILTRTDSRIRRLTRLRVTAFPIRRPTAKPKRLCSRWLGRTESTNRGWTRVRPSRRRRAKSVFARRRYFLRITSLARGRCATSQTLIHAIRSGGGVPLTAWPSTPDAPLWFSSGPEIRAPASGGGLWAATFVSAFLSLTSQIHSKRLYLLFPLPANPWWCVGGTDAPCRADGITAIPGIRLIHHPIPEIFQGKESSARTIQDDAELGLPFRNLLGTTLLRKR